jgi:hypothetical protein
VLVRLVSTRRESRRPTSACLGFFRTGVRSDSSRGFLLDLDALDDNPIVKWAEFHGCPSKPLGSAIFACPDSRS